MNDRTFGNGVVYYSARRGRSKPDITAARVEPKVTFAAAALVQTALPLFALSWLVHGPFNAVVASVSYVGVTSLLQLWVLKRQELRFIKGKQIGSTLRQLALARRLTLCLVGTLQVALLAA